MPTHLISFANSAIAIDCPAPHSARIVRFLFGDDFPVAPNAAPQVTYRLDWADGLFTLSKDGETLLRSASEAGIADTLLGSACYQLAWHSQGGLLFHAGGLEWQQQGLLLPGTMGAGKTTLTAHLLGRGFNYLSDEMVFVPHAGQTMEALPRPLNLKLPARAVLKTQLDYALAPADHIYCAPATDLVPPRLFNPRSQFSAPPLRLIIFPRYQADSRFELQPLTKAQTGLALMQCLINARNLPGHGFAEISRLAKTVPAYTMRYPNFNSVGETVERLLRSLP